MATTETVGIGLIGYGFMGRVHSYGYINIPLFYDPPALRPRLVGVADATTELAEKAAAHAGFEFGTDTWQDLIERDDIQIIDICSPNAFHIDQVLAAIAAGKHIYCEKPVVVSDEEADRVEEALRSYSGIAQTTLNYRFFPAMLRAKQLVDTGRVGNVVSFRGAYLHSGNVDAKRPMHWKQLKSAGGGVLRDCGPHVMDTIDYLIGPLDSIFATSHILYPQRPTTSGEMMTVEAEDNIVMLARLPNGAIGTMETSKIATGADDELRYEIHGDKGAIRFNSMNPNYLEFYDLADSDQPLGGERGWQRIASVNRYQSPAGFPGPKFAVGWIRAHMHCLYSFLDSVAKGTQGEPSLKQGLRITRMITVAECSESTQTWQKVPAREE